MKFVVFGSAGMLGKAVGVELNSRGHQVVPITHAYCSINDYEGVRRIITDDCDAVINCAGLHKGREVKPTDHGMFLANALGPGNLLGATREVGVNLVHVSTDCVFTGKAGPYRYDDIPDATDGYGLSKAIGETIVQSPNVTVVRTSFIGFEHGLLHWLLAEAKAGTKEVDGWAHAFWSGSTVYAVARGLANIAEDPLDGILHLATRTALSKYQVLVQLSNYLNLDIKVRPVMEPEINRELVPSVLLEPLVDCLPELKARLKWSP